MNNLDKERKDWIMVAQAVMAGKYIKADDSTLTAIRYGLKWFDDPICVEAMKHLGGRRAR